MYERASKHAGACHRDRSAGVGCNSSWTVGSVLRGKSIICLKRLSMIG